MPSPQVVDVIERKLTEGDFVGAISMDLCLRRAVRIFVQDLVFIRSQVDFVYQFSC